MRSTLRHDGQLSELNADQWLKTIEQYEFSAVIFDCDGTLVNSASAHETCMRVALEDQGKVSDPDWYLAHTGLDRRSLFNTYKAELDATLDVELACQVSIAVFRDTVSMVHPVKEVTDLLDPLSKQGIPMAVATNAERSVAELSLTATNLKAYFQRIVCVEDVKHPKPAPDLFQQAAVALQIPPERTLVFEDSREGELAAVAAKMSVCRLL